MGAVRLSFRQRSQGNADSLCRLNLRGLARHSLHEHRLKPGLATNASSILFFCSVKKSLIWLEGRSIAPHFEGHCSIFTIRKAARS